MSSKSDKVNKEEISITNVSFDKNWQNWNLPLVPQNKIYKKNNFFKYFISFKLYNKNCRKNLIYETKFWNYSIEIDKNIKKLLIYTFWFSWSCKKYEGEYRRQVYWV